MATTITLREDITSVYSIFSRNNAFSWLHITELGDASIKDQFKEGLTVMLLSLPIRTEFLDDLLLWSEDHEFIKGNFFYYIVFKDEYSKSMFELQYGESKSTMNPNQLGWKMEELKLLRGLINVQPMTPPSGQIFTMRAKYDT